MLTELSQPLKVTWEGKLGGVIGKILARWEVVTQPGDYTKY